MPAVTKIYNPECAPADAGTKSCSAGFFNIYVEATAVTGIGYDSGSAVTEYGILYAEYKNGA